LRKIAAIVLDDVLGFCQIERWEKSFPKGIPSSSEKQQA